MGITKRTTEVVKHHIIIDMMYMNTTATNLYFLGYIIMHILSSCSLDHGCTHARFIETLMVPCNTFVKKMCGSSLIFYVCGVFFVADFFIVSPPQTNFLSVVK